MTTDQDRQTRWHIREDADGARQFVMHPENDELFTRTGRQVIEACHLGISIEVWFHERNAMFDHVLRWTTERAARVHACYAAPRGAGIGLFFVPRGESFDFDLADELAKLNGQLVRGFNIGPVEIHQVPADELARFIVLEDAIEIYHNADGAHQAVAAQPDVHKHD